VTRIPSIEYSHWLLTPICKKFFQFYVRRKNLLDHIARMKHLLLEQQPKLPHLFLYGDGDMLIRAEEIECAAGEFKQHGFIVDMHMFHESPHVCHYLVHREQYQNVVEQWLNSRILS